MLGLPAISADYFKNKKGLRRISANEAEEVLAAHLTKNLQIKLSDRKNYDDNARSPRQYYPFNPFKYK